jgi:hypothetical protein
MRGINICSLSSSVTYFFPKESAFTLCFALASYAVGIRVFLVPRLRTHEAIRTLPPYPFMKQQLIPTDQDTISSRNATDAQAQYLFVNDELPLH